MNTLKMFELTYGVNLRNAMHKPNAPGVTDLPSHWSRSTLSNMNKMMNNSRGQKPLEERSICTLLWWLKALEKDLKACR